MNEKSYLDEWFLRVLFSYTPQTSTESWFQFQAEKNKNSPLWKCCNWCCSADWQSRWVKLGQSENMLIQLTLMTIREKSPRKTVYFSLLIEVWKIDGFVCLSPLELSLPDCSILSCSNICNHTVADDDRFSLWSSMTKQTILYKTLLISISQTTAKVLCNWCFTSRTDDFVCTRC